MGPQDFPNLDDLKMRLEQVEAKLKAIDFLQSHADFGALITERGEVLSLISEQVEFNKGIKQEVS